MRHRRESIWIFHPELMRICANSRACPFRVEPGKPGPVGLFRIERHIFRAAVTPMEKKVAYRVITSKNTILHDSCGPSSNGPSNDGSSGRGQHNGNRQNRRGYRGRSTRPGSDVVRPGLVLTDFPRPETLAEAQRIWRQVAAAGESPAANEAANEDMDDNVSMDNDILDLFADENLDGASPGDGSVHVEDIGVDASGPNVDAELEGLLAEASARMVSSFFMKIFSY